MKHIDLVKFQASFLAWRFYFIIIIILVIVIGLLTRLIDLAIYQQKFLLEQGNTRSMRVVTTPVFRGMILDRNGSPLAISASIFSIWANPQEFMTTPNHLQSLSSLLGIKETEIAALIKSYREKEREFVYLKREVSPEVAEKVKKLAITGVYQQESYKRFYPEAEVAGHVVGFTNRDDQGQEGMELAYNDWLKGAPGKKAVVKDRRGRVISEIRTMQKQKPGNDLVLSIDRRIQYIAYRELMVGLQKYGAVSGSVLVLDVSTGEILAMVNQPSFNPNNRSQSQSEDFRNRAVTDTFEPGSTMKAFSVASALESGLFKPDTIIDTNPGWLRVGRNIVRDEHSKGPMTVTHILQISSNVGVTKMILTLPPQQLWTMFHHMGFGQETGLGFPGERSGSLVRRDKWPPFALATLSWGYGISTTPLQLAHAYATIANDGISVPPTLLKLDKVPKGKRVMKSGLSRQMIDLLEAVVSGKEGTGKAAMITGYRVAGKTGTSRVVGEHGYDKHRHNASFIGMAPATHPRLVVAVTMNDLRGKKYYAMDVAAPIFKSVMEGSLRVMNIPPDNLVPTVAHEIT